MKYMAKNNYWFSHGSGKVKLDQFGKVGSHVIIESSVLVFHPESISLGNNVYVGHLTILHGYYKNRMVIGDGTWVGQMCYFHSGGGIEIGKNVGIGPQVKILTSSHDLENTGKPIIQNELIFGKVIIEDDCDIGTGAIILPGVTIGSGAQVGAGAVVTKNVKPYSIVGGVPAKLIRSRISK